MKERAHIKVGSSVCPCIGYIKSVSYSRHNFYIADTKLEAKGYASAKAVEKELANLRAAFGSQGFVFYYD